MVFDSYIFLLLFLPAFLLAYHPAKKAALKSPKYRDISKWLIIAASLIFYAPFGIKNMAVLLCSVIVNALFGYVLINGKEKAGLKLRVLAAFFLAINIVSLLFFKFSGVFFPVAVSFYTFNQISFLVDAYRGDIEEFSLPDYLCYILFFPKLLQGPLMGYGKFGERLEDTAVVDAETILRGILLFSMGIFKKVILADTFGKAVDYGFGNVYGLGSLEAVLVAVFYSLQLYFDFCGYCDMAGAVCMFIGFDLPLNFNSPYKAVDIMDFWKRWHISLTGFFTRYVYIPLGGNRKGALRMYLNFLIVFLLSGIWHGSGITFIVWGAMHGVLYVLTRMVRGKDEKRMDAASSFKVTDVFRVTGTFIYVTLAWVFFRAATVKDAIALITRMFTGEKKPIATQLSSCFQLDELWYVIKVTPIMKTGFAWESCMWLFLALSLVMVFFCPNAVSISKKCKIGLGTTLASFVLLIWSILSLAGVSTFLYMNF